MPVDKVEFEGYPDEICFGGSVTPVPTATAKCGGEAINGPQFTWELNDIGNTGSNIDPDTGVVTSGNNPGSIEVRAVIEKAKGTNNKYVLDDAPIVPNAWKTIEVVDIEVEIQGGGTYCYPVSVTLSVTVTCAGKDVAADSVIAWDPDPPTFSTPGSHTGTVTVTFRGRVVTESATVNIVVVEIDKCPASFEPKGGSQDNLVVITARVLPNTVTGQFRFTLYDTSDEPGYCLNAPIPAPASGEDSTSWEDLQFPSQTGYSISGTNDEVATTTATSLNQATVTVKSYDYGAYGKIKAEFTAGGTMCLATETGGTRQYTNIPLDDDDNHVLDGATQNSGPGSTKAAGDDGDNQPAGKIGDGFTRYEEWRGFMIGGSHHRFDVSTRDLLVYDHDSIGLGYYSSGSGISTHLIRSSEWTGTGKKADGKRVVNPNRETSASSVQYGLHLYAETAVGGSEGGYCYGDPTDAVALGPPNACWKIRLNTGNIAAWFPAKATQVTDRSIAHEMGHGTAVPHHVPDTGGALCPMREPCSDTNIGTTFCTTGDNCQGKIDVKDP